MNNLRLVRDNSKIFSPLFFSNFSAPNPSNLKYFRDDKPQDTQYLFNCEARGKYNPPRNNKGMTYFEQFWAHFPLASLNILMICDQKQIGIFVG